MSESSQEKPEMSAYEKRVECVARKIRHIGYAIFGGLAVVVTVFLIYQVVRDINNDEVNDPYTHQPISKGASQE